MKAVNIHIDEWLDFNTKVFPKRKNIKLETYLHWRILNNPFYTFFDDGLIAQKDDQIIGQIIPIYSKLVSGENTHACVWGSDYIVDKPYRGGDAGVKVLRKMMKKYLHFGAGMPEISLKIHEVLGEEPVAARNDLVFLAGAKKKISYRLQNPKKFFQTFESEMMKDYAGSKLNYFARNAAFYDWIFSETNRSKLTVLRDNDRNGFILFYQDKVFGVPMEWIVDYSPAYYQQQARFSDTIHSYGRRSFKKLFFYSGTIDFSDTVISLRKRVHPIYSNIKRKMVPYEGTYPWHVTGLDSDRFISNFL